MSKVRNVLCVGIGGQGVLTAAQIIAEVAFACGNDVKQSEVHGMSQRGGSVECQVRFDTHVASPLIPGGAVDYLIALESAEGRRALHQLNEGGRALAPTGALLRELPHPRTLNVAVLGALSTLFPFPVRTWRSALRRVLPAPTHRLNLRAFALGRRRARECRRALSEHGRQGQRLEADR